MKDEMIFEADFEFTVDTIRELTNGKGEEDGIFEQSTDELHTDKSEQE